MSTQEQLEKFRTNFPLTRVVVYDEFMTYKVRRGLAKSVTGEANELIDKLGLELVAVCPNGLAQDSVVIQQQYMQIWLI